MWILSPAGITPFNRRFEILVDKGLAMKARTLSDMWVGSGHSYATADETAVFTSLLISSIRALCSSCWSPLFQEVSHSNRALLVFSWTMEKLPWQISPRLSGASAELSLAGIQSLAISTRVDVPTVKIILWAKIYQMQTEEEIMVLMSYCFPPTLILLLHSIWNSNGKTCLCDYYQ